MSKLQTIGGLKWKWHRRAVAIFLWLAALIISLPSAEAADARAVLIGAFDHPLYIASAPGQPRLLFIVEQSGRIQVLQDEVKLDHPFLDISGLISFGSERGLLSIAFPPNYDASGRLYVAFTNANGHVELDEFIRKAGDPTRANPASRRIVLIIPHPGAANHNGGQLQFGPRDGLLYMSVGDGGNLTPPGEPARNLDDLRGKILRIGPLPSGSKAYRIPLSNPYVGKPGRDEIYAYGLRNPWRFSFNGSRLVIADVGQTNWEEVNFLVTSAVKGVNFGWPQYEGDAIFDNTRPGPDPPTFPIFTYDHSSGRCAIIGGYVVQDPNLLRLTTRYLYGDYCTGEVRSLSANVTTQYLRSDRPTGVTLPSLSSFGVGAQAQIYIAQSTGNVSRLAPP
jgi:hypothetical protein